MWKPKLSIHLPIFGHRSLLGIQTPFIMLGKTIIHECAPDAYFRLHLRHFVLNRLQMRQGASESFSSSNVWASLLEHEFIVALAETGQKQAFLWQLLQKKDLFKNIKLCMMAMMQLIK